MSKKKDDKKGSNPNGTTSPSDIAAIVARIRKDKEKGRHKRGDQRS